MNKVRKLISKVNYKNFKKIVRHIKINGYHGLRTVIYEHLKDPLHYNDWFERHKVTESELEKQREYKFGYSPLISILVPTYNTDIDMFHEMIDSVKSQSYSNWELCIADASVGNDKLRTEIKKCEQEDERIKVVYLEKNTGISGNTNSALALATGEFVGLLDHDDIVEPDLLYEVVRCLQDREVDSLYTDEDKVDDKLTEYSDPNFKPDFSIDLLRSHNYITHFFVCRKSIIYEVGGFRSEFDGAQDYDLVFRCSEKSRKIRHISKPLYHWRMCEGSTADDPKSKLYCYEAGRKAIEEHLKRQGIKAEVGFAGENLWGLYHVKYDVIDNPLVSIVIANMDHVRDLEKCVTSIQQKSTYRNFEFIIVENNSKNKETFEYYNTLSSRYSNVKIVKWNKEFNYSAINNFGVENANGEYILLLNNDTELITADAIEEMLGICERNDVGAVGAKLLYKDNTVQHAGVIIGFGNYAGHIFTMKEDSDYGYMMRAQINCNYNAVTAACLMVSKTDFVKVGGLTEELAVAGNDIDFCLKLRKTGLLVVYDAFAKWHHYESKSRGYETTPEKKQRYDRELEIFRNRWSDVLKNGDEYYNKNFPITIAPFTLD